MCLTAGGVLLLQAVCAAEIRCHAGCLWITQAGDGHDYVLRAGHRWNCAHGQRVAIQALEDAEWTLEINRPEEPRTQ